MRHRSVSVIARFTIATVALLLPLLMLSPQSAEAHTNTPCPHFSVTDILNDLWGDWDHDRAPNGTEFYNGLKPCVPDATEFCTASPSKCLAPAPVVYRCSGGYWTHAGLASNPHGDWDGDGISNIVEVNNGANPCKTPCPYPTYADLRLNPNGDWDYDGSANSVEVWLGSDPCSGASANPCPHWTTSYISYYPYKDWDGDGVTNYDEWRYGTNPCVANVVIVSPTPTLPHIGGPSHPAPAPAPTTCPPGYPYLHPENGKCYANPIYPWQ